MKTFEEKILDIKTELDTLLSYEERLIYYNELVKINTELMKVIIDLQTKGVEND